MKIILYYEKFLYIFRQYVALILARGGSKQIPRKNLATIEGKSLLKRTIETAKSANGSSEEILFSSFILINNYHGFIEYFILASTVFQDVWVSTDDLEIYTEAAAAGAKVFGRSQESSTDNAGSIIAVLEFYALFPSTSLSFFCHKYCLVTCSLTYIVQNFEEKNIFVKVKQ